MKLHFKYHLTKHQGLILGAIGSALVAVFGPDSTLIIGTGGNLTHLNLAIVIPALLGLSDSILHNVTGVTPVKPGTKVVDDSLSEVDSGLITILQNAADKWGASGVAKVAKALVDVPVVVPPPSLVPVPLTNGAVFFTPEPDQPVSTLN